MNAAVRPSLVSPQRWLSPGLFDFWAGKLNPLWTLQQPMARLLRREPAGQGASTLVLRTNRHWRGMQPGQHVTLGVELDGRILQRSYSPTLLGRRELAITVKAVDGGRVSHHLAEQARPGTVFHIGQAFGEFSLPAQPAPLLLLAAGSGITPMRSLLRSLLQSPLRAPVDLFYWERDAGRFNFADELAAMAAGEPQLGVHLCATRGSAPALRVNQHALGALEPSALLQRQVLACGPDGFVAAARARLQGQVAGFQAEAFTPPAASELAGTVQLTLARSGRQLTVPRGQSLLDSLEAQGIKPKHGCRMGICNTCTCTRMSGGTRHLRTGEEQGEPAHPLRICINAPTTDLVLDL